MTNAAKMVSLEKVPVVEVNTDNIGQIWPAIIQAIQSATFLAIDTVSKSLCVCVCGCVFFEENKGAGTGIIQFIIKTNLTNNSKL